MTDVVSVAALQTGSPEAFALLVDQYSDKIYRLVFSIVQRQEEAEDITGKHVTYEQVQGTSQHMSSAYMHPGMELENQERGLILSNALNQLTEQQRIAFTMNKTEGFSYEEIAQAMNLSKSSIESLIFRARKQLQVLLAAYYDEYINR
ncbi:MAG: sigma-70 family RNA polymerase sigma factor [Flavobacteriia bacterium]|nr:sigma-70 family RNA polymerase sigma factor [Flavobacteriia bacterium]